MIDTYCRIQQRLELKYFHLAHFSFNTHGSDRVDYNLQHRPAVDAACPSAVDEDSAGVGLLLTQRLPEARLWLRRKIRIYLRGWMLRCWAQALQVAP